MSTMVDEIPQDSRRGLATMGVLMAAGSVTPFLLNDNSVQVANAWANLGVFSGYLFVAAFIAPWVVSRYIVTKVAMATFFLTCGITHLSIFLHAIGDTVEDYSDPWHTVNHNVQVIAAFFFLVTLWVEFIYVGIHWPPRLDLSRMFRLRRER